MNRNLKTSSMTEAAMISGILVIFAYISSFLFSPLMFFYPLPAIILAKRKGLKYAVLSLVAADIIISMLLGIQIGIAFLLLFSPFGIALSYGICKDENPNKTIIIGAVCFMISFLVMILGIQVLTGINFIEQMVQITNESFNIYRDILTKTTNDINANKDKINETLSFIEQTSKIMIETIRVQFPSIIISGAMLLSYMNYFVVSKIAKRFSVDIKQNIRFGYFSFPRTFIIAMSVLLLLSILLKFLNMNFIAIQMNILMISFMAMFIQGLAVLKFFLMKRRMNKVLSFVILLLVIITPAISQSLVVVGVIDLIIDIRKLKRKII